MLIFFIFKHINNVPINDCLCKFQLSAKVFSLLFFTSFNTQQLIRKITNFVVTFLIYILVARIRRIEPKSRKLEIIGRMKENLGEFEIKCQKMK